MNLNAMRAIGATPAGRTLMDELYGLYEAERDNLLSCDPDRTRYYQGSASAYKRLIDGFKAATKNTI